MVCSFPGSFIFAFNSIDLSANSATVQLYRRSHALHLRRRQRPLYPHGLGVLSRIEPENARGIINAHRTLFLSRTDHSRQEIDLLFEADSPWVWDAEKHFARLKEENPNLVMAASRGNSVVDPEAGSKKLEMQETPSEERQEVAKTDDKA